MQPTPFCRAPAHRLGVLALVAWTASSLAACSKDGSDEGNDKVVTIGVVAPLDAGLTEFGLGIRDSVELAVQQANAADLLPGWTLQVKAVDDSSDPVVGAENVVALTDDPTVAAVIGTYNSGVAVVVAPLLEEVGIAMVSPANTDPTLTIGADPTQPQRQFSNYYRMVATDADQGGFLAQYLLDDTTLRRVAIITDEKPVSKGLADDFSAKFTENGGTVDTYEVVPKGDTDYAAYAERAAAGNPDLLFFGGEYDNAALVKKAAVAAGLTVPLMGGDGIQAQG